MYLVGSVATSFFGGGLSKYAQSCRNAHLRNTSVHHLLPTGEAVVMLCYSSRRYNWVYRADLVASLYLVESNCEFWKTHTSHVLFWVSSVNPHNALARMLLIVFQKVRALRSNIPFLSVTGVREQTVISATQLCMWRFQEAVVSQSFACVLSIISLN